MIKIEDLRIGNWVLYDGKAQDTHMWVLEDVGLIPGLIKPMPLTTELLDKNNIVLYEQDSDLFNLCCVKQNGVVLAVFSRPETQVFVHSLQNIIYSITGRELNIEP